MQRGRNSVCSALAFFLCLVLLFHNFRNDEVAAADEDHILLAGQLPGAGQCSGDRVDHLAVQSELFGLLGKCRRREGPFVARLGEEIAGLFGEEGEYGRNFLVIDKSQDAEEANCSTTYLIP